MIKLNTYINEAWSGVKKQSYEQEIKSWCEEMGIKNYTINSQGEIDVDDSVCLDYQEFKELPYKFGTVTGYFNIGDNRNLTSLKNCPNYVQRYFSCDNCCVLKSLEGCPKEVGTNFYCRKCKRKFTEEEVMSLCEVENNIFIIESFEL